MTPTLRSATRTDAGLATEFRIAVMRLARRARSEHDPEVELSSGQLGVLGVLFRAGEATVGQLAAHERVQPPSMTRTINCLAEAGFVERRPSPEDGRVVLVDLSERGRETVLAERRRRDAWMARRVAELSADERALLREVVPILERLATE